MNDTSCVPGRHGPHVTQVAEICVPGRHGPHVTPVAAIEAGGRSWFTTVG